MTEREGSSEPMKHPAFIGPYFHYKCFRSDGIERLPAIVLAVLAFSATPTFVAVEKKTRGEGTIWRLTHLLSRTSGGALSWWGW